LYSSLSDDRSADSLSKKILNAVEMRSLMGDQRPNCLILDEIDGSLASEERVNVFLV
jgi:chromosome transmission fidelity protein 18